MFKLSSEASLDGAISVENKFIVDYMPYADGDYVKIYLYGLSLAARKGSADDTVERLARRLDIDVATVNAAIDYWCDRGLMSRLDGDICYFSPRSARPKIKKWDVDEYAEFNRIAQLYITGRQILSNEYNEYYSLMEQLNIEWQAMACIIKYCADLKGENVAYQYVLAVARNLAEDGHRSFDEVNDKLDEYGVYYNDLRAVLGAMGKRSVDPEAVKLYKKWKNEYKFDFEVILHVAQKVKRGGLAVLDEKLSYYREMCFFTTDIIDKYEEDRKSLYTLAKTINKSLGVYYENVDPELTAYIKPWLSLGFEPNALVAAAEYCMRNDLKRLSDLDATVRDLFGRGLTTEKQVRDSVDHEKRFDADIEKLNKKLGIKGAAKDIQRAYIANWKEKWAMPQSVIDHAASLSAGKSEPYAYMNRILLTWHNSGVSDLDAAKRAGLPAFQTAPDSAPKGIAVESRSAEELNALFTQISEDD